MATAEGVVVADLGLEAGESMGLACCCCEVGGPPENRVKHWTTSVKTCSKVSSNKKQLSRPNGRKVLKILSCRMGYARVKQKMLPVSIWKCGFKLLSTPGLQIRHFEKNSRAKKLITQGKNSITQQKNSRI